MRYLLISLWLGLVCSADALAQTATFTYQRGAITLLRAHPPVLAPMPWQDKDAPKQSGNPVIEIAVDIRPASSFYRQEGWINMGGLSGLNGMLYVFEKPKPAHVGAAEYHQPLDVLWIDAQGMVTSIAPSLLLADIREPILDQKPSKALLLLAGGMVQENSIAPGDKIVESEFFEAPPEVMSVP